MLALLHGSSSFLIVIRTTIKALMSLNFVKIQLLREPVIGLIKWLRPKSLKVCSYVEKCAEFTNQTLKKIGWYTKVLCAT